MNLRIPRKKRSAVFIKYEMESDYFLRVASDICESVLISHSGLSCSEEGAIWVVVGEIVFQIVLGVSLKSNLQRKDSILRNVFMGGWGWHQIRGAAGLFFCLLRKTNNNNDNVVVMTDYSHSSMWVAWSQINYRFPHKCLSDSGNLIAEEQNCYKKSLISVLSLLMLLVIFTWNTWWK